MNRISFLPFRIFDLDSEYSIVLSFSFSVSDVFEASTIISHKSVRNGWMVAEIYFVEMLNCVESGNISRFVMLDKTGKEECHVFFLCRYC